MRSLFSLESDENYLSIYDASENWSSTQMTWANKIPLSNKLDVPVTMENNYLVLNITDFTKKCVLDKNSTMESIGLIMNYERDKYYIVASNNNGLYPSFVELVLNRLPYNFFERDNINPPIQ